MLTWIAAAVLVLPASLQAQIDGNAAAVRVTEAMDDTPPAGDPVAWLHVGGTGIVTAARHLVRLTNGNLYPTSVQ